MINLEEIKNQLLSRKSVEEIFKNFDWKEFENTIAEIFRSNEFVVRQNFRFKAKRRYEIDLVAVRGNICLCVDCKGWSRGRNKTSALKKAVVEQENRLKEFKKFLKKNFIAQKILRTENTSLFLPLLATLAEEDIIKQNQTCVVPFEKLNAFLLEIEKYT